MKMKRFIAFAAACIMGMATGAMPVMAAGDEASSDNSMTISKDIINDDAECSLTIYKLRENSGNTGEGDGQVNLNETRGQGMKNVVFSEKKIADFINVSGDNAAGLYFTNLDKDFVDMVENTFVGDQKVDLSGTVIDGVTYYTTEQMERIIGDVEARNGDGKTYTGDTKIIDYLTTDGTVAHRDFDGTDSNGRTKMTGLDVGLYLVAETGYVDKDTDEKTKTVYRTHIYDDAGIETDTDNTVNTDDRNYNDSEQANYENAMSGTQNPEIVDNPSSPFLISLPTTNMSRITSKDGQAFEAGTVWQYDVTTYPKNSTTSIYKRVLDDDGNTLDEYQDYHIGQNIHQVIWADVPATMFTNDKNDTRKNKEYNITDTMSKGLTFQKVTRVALGSKVASPQSLSDFDNFTELTPETDYTIDTIHTDQSSGNKTAIADMDPIAYGVQNIQGFTVKLTKTGLEKLDAVKTESQVVVEFDTVLNKDAVIGSADGKTFNINYPTLTFRNQNTLERTVEGNEIKIYTYELDITKKGTDIQSISDPNGKNVRDAHDFNTSNVSFTVRQQQQSDPYGNKNYGSAITKDAYVTFVKESDGVYHVWTPSDGQITRLIKWDTAKNENGVYEPTTVGTAENGIEATQIISPAPSSSADGSEEEGKLIIKGLDSETYTFTEKSTSAWYDLLKSEFDVTLKANSPKDGNLVANAGSDMGASLTTDGKTTALNHDRGIATLTVNNYKSITLHTGGIGTTFIYIGATAFAVMAFILYIRSRKKYGNKAA